jgi:hypothetical protein
LSFGSANAVLAFDLFQSRASKQLDYGKFAGANERKRSPRSPAIVTESGVDFQRCVSRRRQSVLLDAAIPQQQSRDRTVVNEPPS